LNLGPETASLAWKWHILTLNLNNFKGFLPTGYWRILSLGAKKAKKMFFLNNLNIFFLLFFLKFYCYYLGRHQIFFDPNRKSRNRIYAIKGAFLTLLRAVNKPSCQKKNIENSIFTPTMGSCILVVNKKNYFFFRKKKILKENRFYVNLGRKFLTGLKYCIWPSVNCGNHISNWSWWMLLVFVAKVDCSGVAQLYKVPHTNPLS
jgi:hypothetical protein